VNYSDAPSPRARGDRHRRAEANHFSATSSSRIILTEHGFDDVSDVKPWAEKLPQTPPYYNPRGFKSLVNAWNFLFPQWRGDRARAYFEQIVYLDRYVYQASPVEAQLLYCWGHTSQDWEQFDIQQEYALHELLASYARLAPPEPQATPPPASSPPPTPAPPLDVTQITKLLDQINQYTAAIRALLPK
jgi:hypothetical protein